jgi:phosphatidylglycerol lysyltransferase
MASHVGVRRVLREWVDSRRLPPLRFLVEPDVLDGIMQDRPSFVAMRDGNAVAFLVASPVVAKNGFLVELLARSPSAPNGTSELLIDAVMRWCARENYSYVTLGLVALATAARRDMGTNPIWLRAGMNFARAHANRFYNFRGLEQFRLKLMPDHWETIYAISNEKRFSIRTLYSVGAAFSGISPWVAIAIGFAKAIQRELGRKPRSNSAPRPS